MNFAGIILGIGNEFLNGLIFSFRIDIKHAHILLNLDKMSKFVLIILTSERSVNQLFRAEIIDRVTIIRLARDIYQ